MEERIVNYEKGDGKPYLERAREKYANMTEEQRKEIDKLREQFFKKYGVESKEDK